MRGLAKYLFVAGAITLGGSPIIWGVSGWSPPVKGFYYAAMVLLMTSLVLWLYGQVYWRVGQARVWASRLRPAASGNAARRRMRGRRDKLPAFLEPMGVNQGIRDNEPEKVAAIEACEHPDFTNPGGRWRWDCVACSLTVVNYRKPRPGRRNIA